jgi:hypothetical protein
MDGSLSPSDLNLAWHSVSADEALVSPEIVSGRSDYRRSAAAPGSIRSQSSQGGGPSRGGHAFPVPVSQRADLTSCWPPPA